MITTSVMKGLNVITNRSLLVNETYVLLFLSSQYFIVIRVSFKTRFTPEAVFQRCSIKRCSSKFRKIHGKHLCQSLFFNKIAGLRNVTLLKKRLQHIRFPVNFVKFLRTLFLQNTSIGCFRVSLFISSKYFTLMRLPLAQQNMH